MNLPKVFKPYGEQIRGCLIADDNQVLCGSDMSSLEDSTKRHLMFFYDPEYVKQMMIPGFDPHMDIAVQAGLLTLEQVQDHKDKVHDYGEIRGVAKQVNFSCVYGAGPPKIASASGMSLELAQKLHKTYWERNWAVKSVASKATHKTVNNQMWLWNPISRFWYSLRNEKDKFSTLNQGLGVYCFDTQVNNVRKEGIKICGQFHDEIIFPLPKGKEELVEKILLQAIENTNDTLKLNVELGISLDFGHRYSDIH